MPLRIVLLVVVYNGWWSHLDFHSGDAAYAPYDTRGPIVGAALVGRVAGAHTY